MFNPLSSTKSQPRARSFTVPASVRGVQFGPEDPKLSEGFTIRETEDGWIVTVSIFDVLSQSDPEIQRREVWPSTALFASVDRHFNTTDKDVARVPFQTSDTVDFNKAAKYLKLGRVSIYNENPETAAIMGSLHRFAFGLYNSRLSSPKLVYDPSRKRHVYRQDYSHRLNDIRQFTPDMVYREVIRWANRLFEEVMTEWGVPFRALNCAGKLETPLGRLPAAVYKIEHVQRDLNIAHDVILQARRHLDMEVTASQESDLRMVYMPPVASWDARGYLPMGLESYARFCGLTDQLDIKQNNVCLTMAMLMGRQMLRSSIGMDFIESIELDTPVTLTALSNLHTKFMDNLMSGAEVTGERPVIIPIKRQVEPQQSVAVAAAARVFAESEKTETDKIVAAREAKEARRRSLMRPERARKQASRTAAEPTVHLRNEMPMTARTVGMSADAPPSDLMAPVTHKPATYMYMVSPTYVSREGADAPTSAAAPSSTENVKQPVSFAQLVGQAVEQAPALPGFGREEAFDANKEAANATAPKLLKTISASELRQVARSFETDLARAEGEGFGVAFVQPQYSLVRDETAQFKGKEIIGKATIADIGNMSMQQGVSYAMATPGRMLTAQEVSDLLGNTQESAKTVMEFMANENSKWSIKTRMGTSGKTTQDPRIEPIPRFLKERAA